MTYELRNTLRWIYCQLYALYFNYNFFLNFLIFLILKSLILTCVLSHGFYFLMFCCSQWVKILFYIDGYLFKTWRRKCNPLQYSCLENLMDGGAWQAIVHGVAKSRTWLSNFTFFFFNYFCACRLDTIKQTAMSDPQSFKIFNPKTNRKIQ